MKITFIRVITLLMVLAQIYVTYTDKLENLKNNLIMLAVLPIAGFAIDYFRRRRNGG